MSFGTAWWRRSNTPGFGGGGTGAFNPATDADYFIDGTNGSDANDGLTPATAKATIQSVRALFDAGAGDKRVYVAPGTYKGGPYFVGGTAPTSRRKIVYYMDGVTVDNADDSAEVFKNAASNYVANLTLEIVGGTLKNVANDCINFGGAHALGSEATVICRGVTALEPGANGDCFSGHDTSIGYAYDCTFTGSGKSAIAHVGNSRTYHYRCTINCGAATSTNVEIVGSGADVPIAYFEGCTFNASVASAKALKVGVGGLGEAEFRRCAWIKGANSWEANQTCGINSPLRMYDCYAEGLNVEGNDGAIFQRCYGDWKIRLGRGTGAEDNVSIENCVFRRTGAPILEWHFYDGGATWKGGAGGAIRNNIFMDAATAISSVTTTGAIDQINALWSFENNCFHNNTANMTVGLVADGADVTGQNPLLVAGTGSNQGGWKVQSGSPCVGTGTDGGNIGLGVAA